MAISPWLVSFRSLLVALSEVVTGFLDFGFRIFEIVQPVWDLYNSESRCTHGDSSGVPMFGKTGGLLAVAVASLLSHAFSGQANAQCQHSGNSQQMRSMQSYLMQQRYAIQQGAMQRIYAQQQAILRQAQQLAALKSSQTLAKPVNVSKLANDSKPTLDLSNIRSISDESDGRPIDAEQAAASSLKMARPLIADPSKRTFARLVLSKMIASYPNTAAAKDAKKLLADLQ